MKIRALVRGSLAFMLLTGAVGATAALRPTYFAGTSSGTTALTFNPYNTATPLPVATDTAAATTAIRPLYGTPMDLRPPYFPPTRSTYLPDPRPDPLP